jgi:hypothetical protein
VRATRLLQARNLSVASGHTCSVYFIFFLMTKSYSASQLYGELPPAEADKCPYLNLSVAFFQFCSKQS